MKLAAKEPPLNLSGVDVKIQLYQTCFDNCLADIPRTEWESAQYITAESLHIGDS